MDGIPVYWLGRVPYRRAWDLQRSLVAAVGKGEHPGCLVLLEHDHVFSMGRRADRLHLRWDDAERARRGVDLVWSDRGGDVTYHGPGQLVGYPILDLRLLNFDVITYVRRLEQSLIDYLRTLGIESRPGGKGLTGVWTVPAEEAMPSKKLAAIGLKLTRSVTSHGFALNLTTDLEIFNQGIVPCGLEGRLATSVLAGGGPAIPVGDAAREYVRCFAATFGLKAVWTDPSDFDQLAPPSVEPAARPVLRVL
jgi:lipoyl(octanoyl) transferase